MTKLLSAGYRRLFRSAFFWIGLVAMCVYSLIGILSNFGGDKRDRTADLLNAIYKKTI